MSDLEVKNQRNRINWKLLESSTPLLLRNFSFFFISFIFHFGLAPKFIFCFFENLLSFPFSLPSNLINTVIGEELFRKDGMFLLPENLYGYSRAMPRTMPGYVFLLKFYKKQSRARRRRPKKPTRIEVKERVCTFKIHRNASQDYLIFFYKQNHNCSVQMLIMYMSEGRL